MSIKTRFKALFNPEMYHGWSQNSEYFEGWYYKLVNKDRSKAFAIIPGIAMDDKKNKHAFIQVLDGVGLEAKYIKFDANDFKPSKEKHELSIKSNYFTNNELILDLEEVQCHLKFKNNVPWPSKLYSPGIMGPFSFVPFMECYHGILSMDHIIEGQFTYKGIEFDFNNGRGYMEKDWGHSFPSSYFWMQSNHFSEEGISLKASVANIPWLGSSFVGFIAGVWLKDRLIQFTTYNFSKLKKSFADQSKVEIEIENRRHKLIINAKRNDATELASPISGFMDGRISESMTSELHVKLFDKKNKQMLLEDIGYSAGLEVAGKIEEIFLK